MGNIASINDINNDNSDKIYGDNNISLLALIHFQKWDHVQNMAKQSNNEYFEIQSMLPMHYAFQQGAPLSVIKTLHEAYIKNIETSFSSMSSYYNYPTSNKVAPKEVIRFLHEKYPQGIETKTSEGNLLLHTACNHNASLDIIQYLLHHYPEGITVRNYYGRLPLHCACSANPSLALIKYLCKMHPEGIEDSDNYGDYPIDVAFQHGASNDVVDFLSNFVEDNLSSSEKINNPVKCLEESNEQISLLFHQRSTRRQSTDKCRFGAAA